MPLSKLVLTLLLATSAYGQIARGGVVMNGGVVTRNPFGVAGGGVASVEDNAYCNSSNIWTGGATDGPAILPLRCLNTALVNTPAPSGQLQATITNSSSPNPVSALQTELTNAVCGEQIVIQAGTNLTYPTVQALSFPAKGCDNAHWIWILSAGANLAFPAFPPAGQRLNPCFAGVVTSPLGVKQWPLNNTNCSINQLATITLTSAQADTVIFSPGADHYRLIGVRITRPSGAWGYKILTANRDGSGNDTYTVSGNLGASAVQVGAGIGISNTSDATFNVNQTVTAIILPSTFKTSQVGKPIASATGGVMSQVLDVTSLVSFANNTSNGPHHIIFDRVWIGGTSDTETGNAINFGDSNTVAVIDSYIDEIHCYGSIGSCIDAKAFAGGVGQNTSAGNYKIVNNFLEASGECALFGGGAATQTPADMEFRRNWCLKPTSWNPKDLANYNGGGPPPTGGTQFNVKNSGELKNFNNVLYEANVRTNSFITSDQRGDSIVLSPKNSGACGNCAVTNITTRYERNHFMGRGIQFANVASDTGSVATAGNSYSVHDVVFDDIGDTLTGNTTPAMFTITGLQRAAPGFTLNNITLNHVTMLSEKASFLFTMGGPPITWAANTLFNTGDFVTSSTYGSLATIFVAQNSGTSGGTEPSWPSRLSNGTVNDNGITWKESTASSNGYLMSFMVIKNSILATGGDGIHSVGGGANNCVNETVPFTGGNPLQKINACWANYTFNNNVLYKGPVLTWPGVNFFPVDGNSIGMVAYNNASNGDYRLCTGVGVPDVSCTAGSPYAANGAHPADDAKDQGADVNLINIKTFGVDVFQ